MAGKKERQTDTWIFKLKTVLQLGFSSLVEGNFSAVLVVSPTLPEVLFVSR